MSAVSSDKSRINPSDVEPGMWIVFQNNDKKELKKGPFKVLNLLDESLLGSNSYLMNDIGKLFNFSATYESLTEVGTAVDELDEDFSIKALSQDEMKSYFDKPKMQQLEDFAFSHLRKLSRFADFGRGYNPFDVDQILSLAGACILFKCLNVDEKYTIEEARKRIDLAEKHKAHSSSIQQQKDVLRSKLNQIRQTVADENSSNDSSISPSNYFWLQKMDLLFKCLAYID